MAEKYYGVWRKRQALKSHCLKTANCVAPLRQTLRERDTHTHRRSLERGRARSPRRKRPGGCDGRFVASLSAFYEASLSLRLFDGKGP